MIARRISQIDAVVRHATGLATVTVRPISAMWTISADVNLEQVPFAGGAVQPLTVPNLEAAVVQELHEELLDELYVSFFPTCPEVTVEDDVRALESVMDGRGVLRNHFFRRPIRS